MPTDSMRSRIHPLDEFCLRDGRPLPEFVEVQPAEIPEPARSLLVHERDMTRTLEQFHGCSIHLRVLSKYSDATTYCRESVLELDRGDQPVEFGAIKIYLERFAEPWRSQILEAHLPLGGILNASGLRYSSRPSAYLRFAPDAFIAAVFRWSERVWTYGRQNTLRDEKGRPLAEIIEILPA
ncbi:MAG TPA: hypothetical protein DCE44_18340 [Verrucomicrobiales bacterium]|nr:hypothetical protein [Verrucomicrobiales bacterium]